MTQYVEITRCLTFMEIWCLNFRHLSLLLRNFIKIDTFGKNRHQIDTKFWKKYLLDTKYLNRYLFGNLASMFTHRWCTKRRHKSENAIKFYSFDLTLLWKVYIIQLLSLHNKIQTINFIRNNIHITYRIFGTTMYNLNG